MKNKAKRIVSIILAISMIAVLFVGCGTKPEEEKPTVTENKEKTVTENNVKKESPKKGGVHFYLSI